MKDQPHLKNTDSVLWKDSSICILTQSKTPTSLLFRQHKISNLGQWFWHFLAMHFWKKIHLWLPSILWKCVDWEECYMSWWKKKSYHKCKHFVNWSAGHKKGRFPNPKCGNPIMSSSQKSFRTNAQQKKLGARLGSVSSQATSETPGTVPTMVGHLPRLLSPLWTSCLNSTLITGFPVYSLLFYPNIIAGTQKGKKKKFMSQQLSIPGPPGSPSQEMCCRRLNAISQM